MYRYTAIIIAFLFLFVSASWGDDKASVFTQKDFARLILQQFSWNDGLPKEPADRDYLLILGGKRNFRYEAEKAYIERSGRVSIQDTSVLGAFTGKGWLVGVSEPTSSAFTALLPIAGEYDFKAVIKGNGFIWNIDGKDYRANSNSGNFKETDIAKVKLKAGILNIKVTIPPEGAIDSFSFSAADHTPIQPFMGWRFRDGLSAARMAEIAVALTNRYALLPDAGSKSPLIRFAAFEKAILPPSAALTTATFLGSFSSAKWVRADNRGATIKIPITVAEAGYFDITANIMGGTISGNVNDTPFKVSSKPYLDKLTLGLFRLESGDNTLSITLPPSGGIDAVELNRKKTTSEDFLSLAGVPGPPDRLIGAEEAAKFLKTIQSSFQIRK